MGRAKKREKTYSCKDSQIMKVPTIFIELVIEFQNDIQKKTNKKVTKIHAMNELAKELKKKKN